jgi:hypothetical protein
MVYSPNPPYEILQTGLVDFTSMQRMRRFARYWDLIANSGNFIDSTPLIWGDRSPFDSFLGFSDRLHERLGQTHAIALERLAGELFGFLVEARRVERGIAAELIWRDYSRGARREVPAFLKHYVTAAPSRRERVGGPGPPIRQARHLA